MALIITNYDDFAKSQQITIAVIAAQAAIQSFRDVLDPGLRRGDGPGIFYEAINYLIFRNNNFLF